MTERSSREDRQGQRRVGIKKNEKLITKHFNDYGTWDNANSHGLARIFGADRIDNMKNFIVREVWPKNRDKVVLLYTGLYDKDHKEVFEGDILDFGSFHGIVEWGMDSEEHDMYKVCGFVIKVIPNDNYVMGVLTPRITPITKWSGIENAKVIGNIYESTG